MSSIEWFDGGDADAIYGLLGQEYEHPTRLLPALCPVCGQLGVHLAFHAWYDTRPSRGGGWAWCSSCHGYGHGSWVVPVWWRNIPGVSIHDLTFSPGTLDDRAALVDEHWNLLVNELERVTT